jgi:hypothetical protein
MSVNQKSPAARIYNGITLIPAAFRDDIRYEARFYLLLYPFLRPWLSYYACIIISIYVPVDIQ